jgi:hypothetical protein
MTGYYARSMKAPGAKTHIGIVSLPLLPLNKFCQRSRACYLLKSNPLKNLNQYIYMIFCIHWILIGSIPATHSTPQ